MKKFLLTIFTVFAFSFAFSQNCSNLFFSEYVEGSSQNKALEIYNPTDHAINLKDYCIRRYSNGSSTPGAALQLKDTMLASGASFIVTNGQIEEVTNSGKIDSALWLMADQHCPGVYATNSAMYFNGNDAMTLETYPGNVIVDLFGKIGQNPGQGWSYVQDSTVAYNDINGNPVSANITEFAVPPVLYWMSWSSDQTLIRKKSVKTGVTVNYGTASDVPNYFNVSLEWDTLPNNTWSNLGSHQCDCITDGIESINNNYQVSVYPNPLTNDLVTIKGNTNIQSIEISNMLGQTITTKKLSGFSQATTVNLDNAKEGIYFVKITFVNNNSLVKKLIVK